MARLVRAAGSPRLPRVVLDDPASGGVLLMPVVALALAVANSPPVPAYFGAIEA